MQPVLLADGASNIHADVTVPYRMDDRIEIASCIENPPRPLASRRVDAPTKQQTLQTSQNLQTNLLGGGFTLPLPPPTAPGRSVVRSVGVLVAL